MGGVGPRLLSSLCLGQAQDIQCVCVCVCVCVCGRGKQPPLGGEGTSGELFQTR